jgi:hypothetical protein
MRCLGVLQPAVGLDRRRGGTRGEEVVDVPPRVRITPRLADVACCQGINPLCLKDVEGEVGELWGTVSAHRDADALMQEVACAGCNVGVADHETHVLHDLVHRQRPGPAVGGPRVLKGDLPVAHQVELLTRLVVAQPPFELKVVGLLDGRADVREDAVVCEVGVHRGEVVGPRREAPQRLLVALEVGEQLVSARHDPTPPVP